MSDQPKTISEFADKEISLLDMRNEEYEVLVKNPDGLGQWDLIRIQAHTVTISAQGSMEFWIVDDEHGWHLVSGIPHGWYGPWRVVDREETPERQFSTDLPDEISEIKPPPAVPDPEESEAELMDKVHDAIGCRPPKRLQDVWEGQGDTEPDGFGVVAKPIEDSGAEEEAYDSTKWFKSVQEATDKVIAELRQNSDAESEKIRQKERLEWLNPQKEEEVPPAAVPLPRPPYSDTNLPYTTSVGSDGIPMRRSDKDGALVEAPDAVKLYAERVAGHDPYDQTKMPVEYYHPVEPYHGKAVDSETKSV